MMFYLYSIIQCIVQKITVLLGLKIFIVSQQFLDKVEQIILINIGVICLKISIILLLKVLTILGYWLFQPRFYKTYFKLVILAHFVTIPIQYLTLTKICSK